MIQFTFDFLPISINKLYVTKMFQRRRFLSTEGRQFKENVAKIMKTTFHSDPALVTNVSALQGKLLDVHIELQSPTWVLKDGVTPRIKDIANLEKVASDSIFQYFQATGLLLDDKQIWKLTIAKKVSSQDKTIYKISEYTDLP